MTDTELLVGELELAGLGGTDLTRGLGRNVAWTYAHVAVLAIVNLVITGVAVRRLGAPEFGYVAAITTFVGLFGMVDFALSNSVVHSTARFDAAIDLEERNDAVRNVHMAHSTYVTIGLATVVFSTGACVVLAVTWTSREVSTARIVSATALFGACTALLLATSAWIGLATGLRRFREIAVSGAIGAVVNVAVVVATLGRFGIAAVPLGQLVGMVASRLLLAGWARRWASWFMPRPQRFSWRGSRGVYTFAIPLLVMSAGAQIVNVTDVVVVGAFGSVAAVGLYKLGNTVPTMLIGMLFRGYDVSFPSLAGSNDRDSQNDATAFLTRLVSFVAGLVFTAMIFERAPVVRLIAGDVDRMAASALAIFAVVWLLNTPVHGLALLLIARGEHRFMAWLVGSEAAANVVLSIIMTVWLGPLGAAWATLITLAVSNLVLLPVLAARLGERSAPRLVWRDGVGCVLLGGCVAAVASIPSTLFDADVERVAITALLCVVGGLTVGGTALGASGRRRVRGLAGATPSRPEDGR